MTGAVTRNERKMAEEDNRTNLIVNYLPQTLTDQEFRQMFVAIGPVKASRIIRDRTTGYSYGFGFVDYVNQEDAEKAISELNGLPVQNKTIKVAFSRNHEDAKGANLYIRNLPRDMTADQLKDLFSVCGSIVNTRILTDQFTGLSKGVGFVLYDRKQEADVAIARFHNTVPPGGTEALNVRHAEENAGKARPPNHMANFGYGGGHHGMNGGGGGHGGGGGGGPMRSQGMGRYRYNPMTGGNMGYGPRPIPPNNNGGFVLFVYNIGTDADETALWQLFSPFGTIAKVDVIRDADKNNQCKGYGFVSMPHYHEAANAITALNGYTYKQRPLQVSFKK